MPDQLIKANEEILLNEIITTKNSLSTDRMDMSFGEIMGSVL